MLARQVVNFDFAWRYSAAVDPRSLQCTYEQDVNYGKGYIWQGPTASFQECCNECANHQTCLAWDWDGNMCYIKDNSDAKVAEHGRWSGRLAPLWSNLSIPAMAEPRFNDSAWELVDTPHDFGRGRELHCLGGGRRRLAGAFHNNCSGWVRRSQSPDGPGPCTTPDEWPAASGSTARASHFPPRGAEASPGSTLRRSTRMRSST